jgi:hypothetical protein
MMNAQIKIITIHVESRVAEAHEDISTAVPNVLQAEFEAAPATE